MTAVALQQDWLFDDADDQLFRWCLVAFVIPLLALSVVLSLIQLKGADGEVDSDLPPRYARLIESAPAQPEAATDTPEPEAAPAPEPVAEPTPEPPRPKPTAREVAARSGVVAFASQLQSLQDMVTADALRASNRKPRSSPASGDSSPDSEPTASAIAQAALADSGGTTREFSSTRASGTRLQEREAAVVDAPVGTPGKKAGSGKSRSKASKRSLDEIQAIFDRNKGGIYTIYNRALRKNPGLKGKVLLRVSIDPSGKVTDCEILSSELGDEALEKKLLARVRLINFGSKSVEPVTLDYPIYFQPS